MGTKKPLLKKSERCLYLKVCYLADELRCFGYKSDCPLYMKSNNNECSEESFNEAMDKLIDKTLQKHQSNPISPVKKEKIS